jgi:hypothetical protein
MGVASRRFTSLLNATGEITDDEMDKETKKQPYSSSRSVAIAIMTSLLVDQTLILGIQLQHQTKVRGTHPFPAAGAASKGEPR